MKICGPKCSLCGVIISIWGIIQLATMGVFYYFKSVALLEDIPIKEEDGYKDSAEFYSDAQSGYNMNAYNCWIAACLYMFTLVFSYHQFWMNSRTHV